MKLSYIPLGNFCQFKYGDSLPESKRLDGKIPVYGSNGIVGWHNVAITVGTTIVIGRKGSIGEIHLSRHPCWPIDTTYYIDETCTNCNLTWLSYALLHCNLTQLNKSAAVPGLNRDDAYRQHILLPSLGEQQRIATLLSKADRLRRLRRYALEVGEGYLQAVFLEMFGDLDSYGGAKSKRLGDLVTITGGGTPPRAVECYFQGDIPWLTSKDMVGEYIYDTQEHITEEAIRNSATKLVPAGSILVVVKSKILARRLPVAMAKVPLCHGQDIKSIQCGAELNPLLLMQVLRGHEQSLLEQARGANTEGLTLPMLLELAVPNVSISRQQEFAETVRQFDRLRNAQREALRQAEGALASLLFQSFRE